MANETTEPNENIVKDVEERSKNIRENKIY